MSATADRVRPDPPLGTAMVVAGYRLERLLSTDSVSRVYRAVSQRDDLRARPVALRVTRPLRTGRRRDTRAIATYLGRVGAAAAVDDPAFVPIVDADQDGDRAHVATIEPPDAVPLGRYVRQHGRLVPEDAVALLFPLAEALDRAHAAGLVHGAISPRTILVRRPGADGAPACLRGFGLIVLLARQARIDRATIDGPDVAYAAPEHLRGGAVDGRADQYALACALYHCVTGRPPFVRDTASGLFGAHLFSLPALDALPGGDRALAGGLRAGLRKRPDQRHASCVDLLRSTGTTGGRHGPARSGGAAASPVPPVRRRVPRDDAADTVEPTPQPTRRLAAGWGVGWPVATMALMLGIVATLGVATLARRGGLDVAGVDLPDRLAPREPAAAAADGRPAAAGVAWQRAVTDEPLHHVRVAGDTVVAAAPHRVVALSAEPGTVRWTRPIDVGVLTDLAVTDDVTALRGASFRGLATSDGERRWQQADIVAPINSLATAGTTIYGIAVGRVSPVLVAVDAATGARAWSFGGGTQRIDDGATVAANDDLVAVLDRGTLWAVDPAVPGPSVDGGPFSTPRVRWQLQVSDTWLDSLALLPDVVVVAKRSGYVCAYDPADGEQRWCEPVAGVADRAPAVVADRDVVAVVVGSQVTALSIASGEPRWRFEVPRPLTPIATSTGRHVVVSDEGGSAHGLDLATGHEVWRASGFGRITALAGTADAVYAGTRAGLLVRLRLPVDRAA